MAYDYRLQTQVDFLDQHPDIDVCSGGVVLIDGESGTETGEVWGGAMSHEEICALTLFQNSVMQTTLMFRRRRLLEAELSYMDGLAEDMGLYCDAVHKIKFHHIAVPLVRYRIWDGGVTSTGTKEQRVMGLFHIRRAYAILDIELSDAEEEYFCRVWDRRPSSWRLLATWRLFCYRVLKANQARCIFSPVMLARYMRRYYKRGFSGWRGIYLACGYLSYWWFKYRLRRLAKV